MRIKKLISICLVAIMVVSTCSVAMINTAAAGNPYSDAAMQLDRDYAYDGELGALYTPEKTTFKVWAPTASKIVLNLYKVGSKAELATDDETDVVGNYDMTNTNGVWSYEYTDDAKNLYYTYTATATSSASGKTTTNETIDPYAKAAGVNGTRGMVVDLSDTDPDGWENDELVLLDNQSEATVWEVHVKDFSYNENSGVSETNRGKYLAFTEAQTTLNNAGDIATGVAYLKELGITHVQINPFYDFGSINEAGSDDQFNWGYDPMNYNIPEGSYSSNPYDGNVRINETKQMIQALHEAGIGVIMDVVYNHTYVTDTSFQKLVPDYYYRKSATGVWSSASGCGNDTASERAMFRKFMIDSVTYWVEEYHVDGFRFDLMGLHDVETMNLIREELDKIDSRIVMYGEGWAMESTVKDPTSCTGETTYLASQGNATKLNTRIALFNDSIRDGVKGNVFNQTDPGFLQGVKGLAPSISYGVRANTVGKGSSWQAVQPTQCVTYVSCHDNQTLYDRLVASTKGTTVDFRTRYADLVAMNKLSGAITFTSQGIGFMLAGEEMARSKDNDHNSYMSPASLNMIDWNNLVQYADVVSYYKGLLEIRSNFAPFTAATKDSGATYTFTNGLTASTNVVAYVVDNNVAGQWKTVGVMFNNASTPTQVELKSENKNWVVIANDKAAGVTKLGEINVTTEENIVTVPARSAMIVVDKASFESASVQTNNKTVTVKHVDEVSGRVLSEQTLLGETGAGYKTTVDSAYALEYDMSRIDGNAEGTFGPADKTVTYYYAPFVPDSLSNANDISGDGVLSIVDATLIQRYLVGLVEFTEDQKQKADFTCDGQIDINDVTMLQKYLADLFVGTGTVTTNYLYIDENGKTQKIAESSVRTARVGDNYTTSAKNVNCYVLGDELPDNKEGVVAYGNTSVNYYYDFQGVEITIHVKHDGDQTWAPTLWAWDDNQVNVYSAWPGYTFENPADSEGWFTSSFVIAGDVGYNLIISNNGAPQTNDYKGLKATDTEIWIVIDDAAATTQGDWITVFTEKPEV